VLTGWFCRRRSSGLRVMLYLTLWVFVTCFVSISLVYSIFFVIERASISIKTILLLVPLVGLILGVILYVVIFPYMMLALFNSFFRERLFACLNLKPVPVVTESDVDTNQPKPDVDEVRNGFSD
jgi:hypothetical protein